LVARNRRGRPRNFEPEAALEAALATFRRHGYSGTSLADLTEATGLNRPSLYATFGNKQTLFERAVDHYWARVSNRCLPALRASGVLADDLRAFLAAFIDVFVDEEPGGCIVACSLPAEVDRLPELRTRLAGFFDAADRAVTARLDEAREEGELKSDQDTRMLASLVVSAMLAFSLRSRAGAPRRELEAQASGLVDVILSAA
jgi:AcrR family transcriptional regulator